MHRRLLASAVPLALCLVLAACDESLSELTGPTPNLQPTLSSITRDIFNSTDAAGRIQCTQCHTDAGGRNPLGGLNLRPEVAHRSLVGVASRGKPGAIHVVPGDPENSYLIHKIEGRPGIVGVRMPRGNGPFLTQGQVLVIKRWIELGARND
jgi:hypothetical protein